MVELLFEIIATIARREERRERRERQLAAEVAAIQAEADAHTARRIIGDHRGLWDA